MTPRIVILSSPSGGGKTTIAHGLIASRSDVGWSVSATTRAPREGERDGIDYHFLSDEEFDRREEAGDFLEWAWYSRHRYGTLVAEVDRVLAQGRHVLLDIEVRGARQVVERRSDVVSIFILPPSAEALVDRLGERRSDDPAAINRRLRRAVEELEVAPEYDHFVVNDVLEDAVAGVSAIVDGEQVGLAGPPDLKRILKTMQRDLAEYAATLPTEQE